MPSFSQSEVSIEYSNAIDALVSSPTRRMMFLVRTMPISIFPILTQSKLVFSVGVPGLSGFSTGDHEDVELQDNPYEERGEVAKY